MELNQILIPIIVLIVSFFLIILWKIFNKNKIEKIKESWGKLKDEYFNFDRISQYHKEIQNVDFQTINSQTQNDIDFEELFVYLDRTTSRTGQQYLYHKLLTPTNDLNKLELFNKQVIYFQNNPRERELIQTILLGLKKDGSYNIPSLLSDNIFKKPNWYNLVKVDLYLTIILSILSIKYHFLSVWLLVPLFSNFVLHFWFKNRSFNVIRSFPFLNNLINISKKFSESDKIKFEKDIRNNIYHLSKFQNNILFLNKGSIKIGGDIENLLYYFLDLVKGFFLVDFFIYFNSINEVIEKRRDIEVIFNYVGWVDVCISVSYIREGDKQNSIPIFTPNNKSIKYEEIIHPLIDGCISNNLNIDKKSILITGSNMSGKSTFLRTILINQLLSQTIYTSFSKSFQTPFLKINSSIRIDDSLLDGKSYYFEEVGIVLDLIKKVEDDCNLFILDEVFKGTNTIERISSSKSILSFLNKGNNIVIVSTHDIELTTMLKDEFDLYHFSEDINEDKLQFDHKLKSGELTTRNGIKLLEICKYPSEIIEESKKISNTLKRYN